MVEKILLLKLSALMKTGSVTKIYVEDGKFVKKGEVILSVEAEKATIDIESPIDGYIKLQCKEGEDYEVGFVLAFIASSLEEFNTMNSQMIGKKQQEHYMEEIKENKAEADKGDEGIELIGVKKGLFEHMQRSREYVQATTFMEVDMQRIKELRIQNKHPYTSFIAYAVIKALKKYSLINSIFLEGKLHINKHINLGIALDNQEKLFVPVIKNAENMDIEEIANQIKTFMEKADLDKLTVDDLSGGTFTITNSGIFGSSFFAPIINYPQSAILGIGKIADRPVVYNNKITIRNIMILSLSYDHRIIVGSVAVKFLSEVRENLEFV